MIPVYWARCDCYAWPLVPGYRVGACKLCGVVPHTTVEEPESGKAEPLR